MIKHKQIYISALCGLVLAVCVSVTAFQADCTAIRQNTLRLHIIANSDSKQDQTVKLAVRDALLGLTETMYAECENQEEAKAVTVQSLKTLEEKANTVLKEAGFNYRARAMIGMVDFNTREYDDFTLPAGNYEALEIVLGIGEGKNWWCVMYPKICFSACAKEDFDGVLDSKQEEIITEKEKYEVAFRFIEIIDEFKQFLKKYI